MSENDVKQFASDKILQHLEEVQAWKKGEKPFAITTEIDPTNMCNHKCPACAGWLNSTCSKDSLTLLEMRDVLKQIKELRGKAVTFTGGGEPLMNCYTIPAINYANSLDLDIGLVTNGSRIKDGAASTLVNCCTWIRVSLDAGSADMHKKIHGTKDYEVILENIRVLVEANRRHGSRCTIGVGYLTGRGTDSYEDMMDFVDTAIELGVDYAQFRPFHTAAAKNYSNFTKQIDFKPFVERSTMKTKIFYSKHKYDCIAQNKLVPEYGVCYGHNFAAVITATGDMTVCCHTRGLKEFTIGDIRENSIKDIWGSEWRKEVIELIDLNKCPALCRANTFNYILWEIMQKKDHVNFL